MAKQRIFDLPETKGTFQVRGNVSGVEKEKFLTEKKTKTGKDFRMVNFGVEFNKDSTMYVSLNGMERDNVYYSRKEDKSKGISKDTKTIPWKDRNSFKAEGYRLIGVNVGLSKILGKDGKEVNDKKVLVEFDACKEISDNLKDNQSVFIRGNTEFSTYEKKHQTKFTPSQISLCKPVDFCTEDFEETAAFTQVIVFTGITPSEDKSKFIVSAKIITYSTVEDAEFIITNPALANQFRKQLKPYTALEVYGKISVEKNVDEVSEEDCWGETNEMERNNNKFVREMVITGAKPSTIDKETYSEEKVLSAQAKVKASQKAKDDYGDADDEWGSTSTMASAKEDDEDPWG